MRGDLFTLFAQVNYLHERLSMPSMLILGIYFKVI